jgi:hypothetical protein
MVERLLTTQQAAEHIGISKGTLQNMRVAGTGPLYIQVRPRGSVRYTTRHLQEWIERNQRTSTSDTFPIISTHQRELPPHCHR